MYTVGVLTLVSYGAQGVIADRLRQHFRETSEIDCLFFYAFDFTPPVLAKALNEALAERCDILITIGRQSMIFVEDYIKANKLSDVPYRVAIAISKPFEPTLESTSIAYTYASATSYEPIVRKCVPHIKRIFAPVGTFGPSLANWEEDVAEQIKSSFTTQGIEFHYVAAENSLALQKAMLNVPSDYEMIFTLEGGISSYIHGLCNHLATTKKVPYFSGNLNNVQTGSAAIGYGANFEVLADAAIDLIHALQKNRINRTAPFPITWIEMPRVFAANTAVAADQGLDVDHIKSMCKELNGILYHESKYHTIPVS